MAIATAEQLQSYLDAFSELSARAPRQPRWLRELRERAFAIFCDTGFPSTKDEDWRFTNVNVIAKTRFEPAREAHEEVPSATLAGFRIRGSACKLVFVNGTFVPEVSDL